MPGVRRKILYRLFCLRQKEANKKKKKEIFLSSIPSTNGACWRVPVQDSFTSVLQNSTLCIWFLVQVRTRTPSSCSWRRAATINGSKLRRRTKRPTERWDEPPRWTVRAHVGTCVLLTRLNNITRCKSAYDTKMSYSASFIFPFS